MQSMRMDKKYQIFVSSTFSDLVEERQAVSRAILDMGHIPAGMEMFPAADVEQLTYIKKVIDECDYYVLIIGARYGSLDQHGVSYTQREFQYAVDTGKTVLAFLHKDIDNIPLGKTDKDDVKRAKLEEFIATVSNGRLVQFWTSATELRANAIVSLTKAFSESPQTGWVRADQVASQSALSDVVKYREENDKLRSELENLRSSNRPSFTDVADLDTNISIPYSAFDGASYRKSAKSLSLKSFFLDVAPALFNGASADEIVDEFERALKERYDVDSYSISAQKSQVSDALMHLVASGYVQMFVKTSIRGGITINATAFQLTAIGTKAWQESSYIKAS